jgi:long-subunit acyl-CoA synthetase (AMP-forming)
MINAPSKATLLDCLEHWATTQPDTVYLTQPLKSGQVVDYTWREVADQVRRMAAHLQTLGLPPRSNIALLGKNSAHWIMADLAIWMAGHITVPLYPTLNADTARYILEHCEARLLLVGKMDEFWPIVEPGIPRELPKITLPLAPELGVPKWEEIIARTAPTQRPAVRTPGELATIIYTSGSTGRPKGVMISFGAMTAVANGIAELFAVTTKDRMLSYLPLAHAAERAILETGSLYFGFRVFFANSLETFLEDLRRAQPTLFFSVPRLWTKFYSGICEKLSPAKQRLLFAVPILSKVIKRKILTQLGLEHVRLALTGSAPLAPSLMAWYRNLGLDLLEGYAMSENFAYSHGNRPGNARIGYVGAVYPGAECRIAENGEVLVKSPGTMLGYYKDPALTAAALTPDGFLKTGDMGELDEQGRLKITGRVKELFKTSKGKYVAPVPIENKLSNHPMMEAVCVTGPSQPQPFALAMLTVDAQKALSNGAADKETLRRDLDKLLQQVNATLEDHEHLDYIVVVKEQWTMENGFLTPTMKIKRNIIEERYLSRADHWLKQRAPVILEH